MSASAAINPDALAPLFRPWEEPAAHRIRADKEREPARVVHQRRPGPIVVAQNIRTAVREWREAFGFRYHFCQREAIETLIYLKEVRRLEQQMQYDLWKAHQKAGEIHVRRLAA